MCPKGINLAIYSTYLNAKTCRNIRAKLIAYYIRLFDMTFWKLDAKEAGAQSVKNEWKMYRYNFTGLVAATLSNKYP